LKLECPLKLQERVECQDRVERRAIRDRVAIDRQQAVRDLMLKGDLSSWLDQRLNEVQQCQVQLAPETRINLSADLYHISAGKKQTLLTQSQSYRTFCFVKTDIFSIFGY
jgi:hypothetical protein